MDGESRPAWLRSNPPARLAYQTDPLRRSLRALSTKWTLLLLRDMAFLKLGRFSDLLRNNPGLTPRVLSRRLKEMQLEGLIVRSGTGRNIGYALTPRGQDAIFVLLAFLKYGLKYHQRAVPTVPSR
ncbi:MAG TPA: helix-turn-helix domain-containing protein [Thermoplasmata archaeon]|nr:helix-turn-helix domain-containing protein [Thermoplasmata archaeon]